MNTENNENKVVTSEEKPKMKRWVKISLIVGVITLAEVAVVTPIAIMATQKNEEAEKPAIEIPSEVEVELEEFIDTIDYSSNISDSNHLSLLFLEQQNNGEFRELDEYALSLIGLPTLTLDINAVPQGIELNYRLILMNANNGERSRYKLTIEATKNSETISKEFFVLSNDIYTVSETVVQTFIDSIEVSAVQGTKWGEYDSRQTYSTNGQIIEKAFNEDEIRQLKIDANYDAIYKPENVNLKYTFVAEPKTIGDVVNYALTIKAYINDENDPLESKKYITSSDTYFKYNDELIQAVENFTVPEVTTVNHTALDSRRTDVDANGNPIASVSKPFNSTVATQLGIASSFNSNDFPAGSTFQYDLIKKKTVFGEKTEYTFALIVNTLTGTITRSAQFQTLRKELPLYSANVNTTDNLFNQWASSAFNDENGNSFHLTMAEMNGMEADMTKEANGWLELDKDIALRRGIYCEDSFFWRNFPTQYNVFVRSTMHTLSVYSDYSVDTIDANGNVIAGKGNGIDYKYEIKIEKKVDAPAELPAKKTYKNYPMPFNPVEAYFNAGVGVNALYEVNAVLSLYKIFEKGNHTYDGLPLYNNYFFTLPQSGTRARPENIDKTTIDVILDILPESQPWIDTYNNYCAAQENNWLSANSPYPSSKSDLTFNVEVDKVVGDEVFYLIKVSTKNIKDHIIKVSVRYNA